MPTAAVSSRSVRTRTRRSLIQFGGLLGTTLVVIGLFSMFSVWSLNRMHAANQRRAAGVLLVLDDGRSAQALFKIQVQEWKNVLLRGAVRTDFDAHVAAFAANERKVQARLASLAARAGGLHKPEMAARARSLAASHTALGDTYRGALDRGSSGRWDPHAIDASVRGIDRDLDEEFDALAGTLLDEAEQHRLEVAALEAERYETLRRFLSWSLALALVLDGLVLWTALRRHSDQA